MPIADSVGTMPTERAHPTPIVMIAEGLLFLAFLGVVSYHALYPQVALAGFLALLGVLIATEAVSTVCFWNLWSPRAIKVGPGGVEILRLLGAHTAARADEVRRTAARGGQGFGLIQTGRGYGCFLSSAQYEAAKSAQPPTAQPTIDTTAPT